MSGIQLHKYFRITQIHKTDDNEDKNNIFLLLLIPSVQIHTIVATDNKRRQNNVCLYSRMEREVFSILNAESNKKKSESR